MALSTYVSLWLGYANVFIAAFIMVYAYLFLHKTNKHRDRKPWDFLFLASFLYLIYQIFNVIVISGVTVVSEISLPLVSNGMSFLYSGAVLLAFISQHDLIIRSHIILISKRDNEKEAEVEVKIGGNEQVLPDSYVFSGKKPVKK